MTRNDRVRDEVASILDDAVPGATPAAIDPLEGGETHEVVAVTFDEREDVVVKYTTTGTDRLRRDRAALRYVGRTTAVPVPSVLAVGEAPPFVVLEAVSGETTPQLRAFDAEEGARIVETAGTLLATLHRDATFESAGRLEGTTDGRLRHDPAESWPALYRDLKRATATDLLDTRFEATAKRALDALPDATAGFTVERPVLAHCDLGPNNVVRAEGEVTGVLDWEWCLAADPAYDLLRAERLFRNEFDDGTRDVLVRGYRRIRPVPRDYDARSAVYRAYESLSAMMSFESWRPDDDETARELADQLRTAVAERLP